MTRTLSAFVVCFLLAVIPWQVTCAQGLPDSGTRTLGAARDSIRIASEPDYPPYCIVNKDGRPDGFSVDLFRAVAEAVHLKYSIEVGVWKQIRTELAEGNIDALPLVGKTPERAEFFDFTFPYLTLHGAVFVREGTRGISSAADLKHKEIIVMAGDNAEEYLRRNHVTDRIITTNTFAEAFRLLAEGEHDAVITQRVLGLNLLKKMKIETVTPLDLPLNDFRQDFCIAVRKGNKALLSRLNEGLSVVIANGTYDQIHLKWFGAVTRERYSYRTLYRAMLFILMPVLLVASLGFIFFLRREVKRRTQSLRQEIDEHKKTVSRLHNQQMLLTEMEKVTQVGGWEMDIENHKISWTDGVYVIYGVTPETFDPSSKDNDLEFYLPEDRNIVDLAVQRAIEFGESYDLEIRFMSADKKLKWVRTSGHPVYRDGKVVRLYGNILDISRQKQVEQDLRKLTEELEIKVADRTRELSEKVEKLNKSQKAMLFMVEDLSRMTRELTQERQKLEAANKELEAFTYSVSHDLRAPVRAMDGFARLLSDEYSSQLEAEGKRMVRIIVDNSRKMGQLIDDLLKFSRLNRQDLLPGNIPMHALAITVYQECASQKEKQEVNFTLQVLPDAYGDVSMVRQVWANLIGNALKFTSRREDRQIEVGFTEDETMVTYFVRDNGAGFDMAYSGKLFGVFQRLHSVEQFEGNGVGLALVQRIIVRLGGKVWAEGKVGEGAVFYFTLPKSRPDRLASHERQEKA